MGGAGGAEERKKQERQEVTQNEDSIVNAGDVPECRGIGG